MLQGEGLLQPRDCAGCAVYQNKPEILPGNKRAWELYPMMSSQVRVAGMGEVIGLDYPAVLAVLALYDIEGEEAIDLFEKLVILFDLFLKDQRKNAAEKEAREKRTAEIPDEDRRYKMVRSN